MPRYLIFWTILLVTCGYALWRGRKYERIAAIVFLTATIASVYSHMTLQVRYQTVDIGEVIVDSGVLVAVIGIALASDRFWPLWVAGLQLTTLVAHLLKAVQLELVPHAYGAAARFWVYPIFLIIVIGTWRTHRRARLEEQARAA